MTSLRPFALALAVVAATPALAQAPEPAKPVTPGFFSGVWYEIARTPNSNEKDCHAPSSQFAGLEGGRYTIVESCRKGGPDGEAKMVKANGQVIPGSGNAKFKMSFLGGLVTPEYWVLDKAEDERWVIMATSGGHYAWLMSRKAPMSPADQAACLSRMAALGFPAAKLEFPKF